MAFDFELARFIPFRDAEACARVRAIRRADLLQHPNPDFHVRIIEDTDAFFLAFALDLVRRIQAAAEAGRRFVAILPCGPLAQYDRAAAIINELRLSLAHVHTFNMDEFADQDGRSAPGDWPGSFQYAMWQRFFGRIDPELRPPVEQIHFPATANIATYGQEIEDLGGAEVCYGGIGWGGHVAFWEAHLGGEFASVEEFCQAPGRVVELHPMTIMQAALHHGGDWSAIPPQAVTIGPAEILACRLRSFWLNVDLGGVSWQRLIGRLVAFGPVTPWVPGSLLQLAPTDYTLIGAVADDLQ
jgi:glucosamine-6-phosphate deaminase